MAQDFGESWQVSRDLCCLILVCREYLIIVGSIPNGAGTMVLWLCSFLAAPLAAGLSKFLNREQLLVRIPCQLWQKGSLVGLPSGADACWLWVVFAEST